MHKIVHKQPKEKTFNLNLAERKVLIGFLEKRGFEIRDIFNDLPDYYEDPGLQVFLGEKYVGAIKPSYMETDDNILGVERNSELEQIANRFEKQNTEAITLPDMYRDLHQIVDLVESPNREPIVNAYIKNAERISKTPGARKKHQAWPGGYLDHVVYAANYALALHNFHLGIGFDPDHNEGDIALVMLLHDFGKIARYRKAGKGYVYVKNPDEAEHTFFDESIQKFGFQLSDIQLNALEFVHGEGSKYTPKGRLMLPLAALCHQADVWNARFCPDNPLPNGKDPWPGAYRHSEKKDLVGYISALNKMNEK